MVVIFNLSDNEIIKKINNNKPISNTIYYDMITKYLIRNQWYFYSGKYFLVRSPNTGVYVYIILQ